MAVRNSRNQVFDCFWLILVTTCKKWLILKTHEGKNSKFQKSAIISQFLRFTQNAFHLSIKVVYCASIYLKTIFWIWCLRLFLESAIFPKISKNQLYHIQWPFLSENSIFSFDLCVNHICNTIPSCVFRISHFLQVVTKN